MERTLVIIKPNAVQRELVGEVISRLEKKGVKIIAMKMMLLNKEIAEKHYAEHIDKSFYEPLIEFITSGPSVVMVVEGESIIQVIRQMFGSTNPMKALPGTIRGDYGMRVRYNVVHASDSLQSAEREINIFFKEEEIINYKLDVRPWI